MNIPGIGQEMAETLYVVGHFVKNSPQHNIVGTRWRFRLIYFAELSLQMKCVQRLFLKVCTIYEVEKVSKINYW